MSSTLAWLPKVGTSFTNAAAWTTYDLSNVDAGTPTGFQGAPSTGATSTWRPHADNVVLRFDLRSKATIDTTSAWSIYDVTRVVQTDAAYTDYTGAAFDGRFVYLLPSAPLGPSFAEVVRYDTR